MSEKITQCRSSQRPLCQPPTGGIFCSGLAGNGAYFSGSAGAWATRAEGHELPAGMQPVHPTKISPLILVLITQMAAPAPMKKLSLAKQSKKKAPAPILIDVTWLELLLPSVNQKVGGKVVIKPLEPNGDFPVPNESSNDANSTANLLEGSLPGDPKMQRFQCGYLPIQPLTQSESV